MFSVNLLQILLEWLAKESLGMIDMDVVATTWLKGICLEGESKGREHNFC